ncbi:MAG: hypothetical protein M1828_006170 [Chrysothrix sp. TS-e1954]|nr:MAG: hypothetical protein M1828_006170 [Chrysothrix sp. TS-e1954]
MRICPLPPSHERYNTLPTAKTAHTTLHRSSIDPSQNPDPHHALLHALGTCITSHGMHHTFGATLLHRNTLLPHANTLFVNSANYGQPETHDVSRILHNPSLAASAWRIHPPVRQCNSDAFVEPYEFSRGARRVDLLERRVQAFLRDFVGVLRTFDASEVIGLCALNGRRLEDAVVVDVVHAGRVLKTGRDPAPSREGLVEVVWMFEGGGCGVGRGRRRVRWRCVGFLRGEGGGA